MSSLNNNAVNKGVTRNVAFDNNDAIDKKLSADSKLTANDAKEDDCCTKMVYNKELVMNKKSCSKNTKKCTGSSLESDSDCKEEFFF